MDFETYRDSIIEDFIEDCHHCGTLDKDTELDQEYIDLINKKFEAHRKCFESDYESAKDEAMELITSCIYGDAISASIECMNCNEVIIDDASLFDEDFE